MYGKDGLKVGGSTGGSDGFGSFHSNFSFSRAEDIFKEFFGGEDPFSKFFGDDEDTFSFGSFGGFGSFGHEGRKREKKEGKKRSPFGAFGGFGGFDDMFGGFDGFGEMGGMGQSTSISTSTYIDANGRKVTETKKTYIDSSGNQKTETSKKCKKLMEEFLQILRQLIILSHQNQKLLQINQLLVDIRKRVPPKQWWKRSHQSINIIFSIIRLNI